MSYAEDEAEEAASHDAFIDALADGELAKLRSLNLALQEVIIRLTNDLLDRVPGPVVAKIVQDGDGDYWVAVDGEHYQQVMRGVPGVPGIELSRIEDDYGTVAWLTAEAAKR